MINAPTTPKFNYELREIFSDHWAKEWDLVATYEMYDDTDPTEEEEDGTRVTARVYRSADNEWSVTVEGFQPKKPVDKDTARIIGVKRDPKMRGMVEYTLVVDGDDLERGMSVGLTPALMDRIIAQAKIDTGLL